MKASILKKLNQTIEEANALKDKKNCEKALKKLQEAINFINLKVKEPKDKQIEIENIKNVMNQTYSVQINTIIQEAITLTSQKEFNKAKDIFQNALKVAENINDLDLKDAEIKELNLLISENELEQTLLKGVKLRDEKNFDKALEIFNKELSIAEDIYNSGSKFDVFFKIKDEINLTYSSQINVLVEQGTSLKQSGNNTEAIKNFEKSLDLIEKYFEPGTKKTEVNNIKNLVNEIYSNQIKPLVEKGKNFSKQGEMETTVSEFKNALNIASKMLDSDLKNLEISLIAEVLNPIYIERIKPIIDNGNKIIEQEKMEESIENINEALNIFREALDIAKIMVNSEIKKRKIEEIKNFINKTCLAGIKVIKDKSLQYVVQKKHDDAIGELYSAVSLAKNMVFPENNNPELDNLKNSVNNIYTAVVEEVVNKGNKLVEQKEFQEAINVFNEALSLTNKMYLTDEMEKEVNMIKSLIYETEVKLLVGKGKLSEEQKVKEKEIKRLKKRLDYANSIEDPDRRLEEMYKVKKMIDDVHSEEIRLFIEQGNQLAGDMMFDDAFEFFEKAIKVNEMMEEPDIKNKDLIKKSYKRELINKTKQEIDNKKFDNAIKSCNRAIELDEKFVKAYYFIGLAYYYKKRYDSAIEYLKKAVDFDNNLVKAWNLMGLSYEAKEEYENALKFLNNTVEIEPNFADGWYNLANIFKQMKNFEKAIDNYKKAIEIDPEFAKAWFFMGSTYFDNNDYRNSIKHLEHAIKLDSDLTQDVNPLIKNLKDVIDKLQESLSLSFINR
ncbi:hypothetical protein LCGC14_0935990 [marine sediment metagenome]|uniref:Uncharacterized protein n=1 Tax=marine sediment metagenome TaxID=412755 RepID=A0A0F9NR27_9ZZZZ